MAQNSTNHSAIRAGWAADAGAAGTSWLAPSLDRITATATDIGGIRSTDISDGDWVVVRTKNSVYSLAVQRDGSVIAAGGWFAAAGRGPERVRVAGCTWGGSAILTGMVAAPGMFLEFTNGVRTTRIHDVRLIRDGGTSTH